MWTLHVHDRDDGEVFYARGPHDLISDAIIFLFPKSRKIGESPNQWAYCTAHFNILLTRLEDDPTYIKEEEPA